MVEVFRVYHNSSKIDTDTIAINSKKRKKYLAFDFSQPVTKCVLSDYKDFTVSTGNVSMQPLSNCIPGDQLRGFFFHGLMKLG